MSDSSTNPAVPAVQTTLTREYGVRHPFVGAGMGFIAHERLAAAVTNAGADWECWERPPILLAAFR